MKLATVPNGEPDGGLVVVSADGDRFLKPLGIPTLRHAIEDWPVASREFSALSRQLQDGGGDDAGHLTFGAPLPRAWQWLDGSAYESHGELMQRAFNLDPIEHDKPLMYQGMSHLFFGPAEDIPFADERDGIDFEGELGVIVDDVPMGVSAAQAMNHIRLLVQINDWSLRRIAPLEMKTGFGWILAKPPCSMAPFAVTPDELGNRWTNGRIHLTLATDWNGEPFGRVKTGAMSHGFHELIAHAAATRPLCAGTVVGSGTVSNADFRQVGSSCIAERRGMEMLDEGEARTAYMKFGDRVFMEARQTGARSVFGAIDQRVVEHRPSA